jgi:hypothetical protein
VRAPHAPALRMPAGWLEAAPARSFRPAIVSASPPEGVSSRFTGAVTCGKSARWHGGVMSPKGLTPIRSITERRSLAPAPVTRCSNRFSYDGLAPRAEQRAYHVPYRYLSGLGRVSRPVARHLRQGSAEPLHLATHLLVQA